MRIKYLAPAPWWSRGVQLLWLLPDAKIDTEPAAWDLAIVVAETGTGLRLTITAAEFYKCSVLPAETQAFLRALFDGLSGYLGRPLSPWGVLTGVRPGKVAAALLAAAKTGDASARLQDDWRLQPAKARLLIEATANSYPLLRREGVSLYISVPFCPSRCDYCSFASLPLASWRPLLPEYLRRQAAELAGALAVCRQGGRRVNSVYVGGGTPTVLSPKELAQLLAPAAGLGCEFTVEAGRPDTLTPEHLAVFQTLGVNRLSVNAQYPKDSTLKAIGRQHTATEFYQKLNLAVAAGLGPVNTDLIVGLPGQSPAAFARIISQLAGAGAANITIHALALKRGARISQQYLSPTVAASIAEAAYERLGRLGYEPYYLYRQRNIASNLENVGFSWPGRYCYYNIASIAESEPVLGIGAGAVSKLGAKGAFRALVNPRDPNQYLARWEELMDKKQRFLLAESATGTEDTPR